MKYIICLILAMLIKDCNSEKPISQNWTVESIDSTSFELYYHIKMKNGNTIIHVLSDKSTEMTDSIEVMRVGQSYDLILLRMIEIRYRGMNLRGHAALGFTLDGVIESGEMIYSSPCIKGLSYFPEHKK